MIVIMARSRQTVLASLVVGSARLFLDLHEVLPAFSPEGHAWRWTIRQEPELSALPRWDLNLPFIIEEIERIEELERFATRISQ
jgi:hypothetical protein